MAAVLYYHFKSGSYFLLQILLGKRKLCAVCGVALTQTGFSQWGIASVLYRDNCDINFVPKFISIHHGAALIWPHVTVFQPHFLCQYQRFLLEMKDILVFNFMCKELMYQQALQVHYTIHSLSRWNGEHVDSIGDLLVYYSYQEIEIGFLRY
ncbi:hypothetical protein ACJX0J_036386 [Zea mays]